MSITGKIFNASFPYTEFEHQALVITFPNDYRAVSSDKEIISPQSSLSDLSQITTPFTEVKNSLHGSNTSLNDEMEI